MAGPERIMAETTPGAIATVPRIEQGSNQAAQEGPININLPPQQQKGFLNRWPWSRGGQPAPAAQAAAPETSADQTAAQQPEPAPPNQPPPGGNGGDGGDGEGGDPERLQPPEPQRVSEAELNPEGKDPDAVVDILLTIDTMDAETRETKKEFFQQACDILQEHAHKSKLLGLDAKIVKLERDFEKADQTIIDEVEGQHPGQGTILVGLLDNLDVTNEEFDRIDKTLRDDQYRGLFSVKEWEELRETRGKLEQDRTNFEQKITDMTDLNFLGKRKETKKNIRLEEKKQDDKMRDEREAEIKQQWAEPEKWAKELEEHLLNDPDVEIRVFIQDTFSKQLDYFHEQIRLRDTKDHTFQQDNLDRAREGLSRYFQEAGKTGVFKDIEKMLERKYQEWANSLMPHREVSQLDMMMDSPGRVIQKTFAELQDEIIDYFNTLLDDSRPQYVEQSARWEFLRRRGYAPQAREVLQGIRAEFVRRAQVQIEDSLSNLDEEWKAELKGQSFIPIQIDRIYGEWNVHRVVRGIIERRERQSLEAGSEPLFREESYYRIKLLGNTRQQLELGADQAADNIIQSATTFDLQAMQQRMEMLLKALREKSADLQRSERISKKEADALIEQMEDSVTNKIDFYILDWAGGNLQMDLFSSYLEQRVRIRGVEKLRQIPAMIDGKVGIALLHLLSEQYRLYYRPQGWKGQLFDDDTTHKFLRSKIRSIIINSLMEYELRDDQDQDKNRSRENLTRVSTVDQFLSNFKHKNKLIDGKEFKDFTDEERNNIVTNLEKMDPEAKKQLFTTLTPGLRKDIRKWHYELLSKALKQLFEEVKQKGKNATSQDFEGLRQKLEKLRISRRELASELTRYEEAERKATSAFNIANQVMNIFGESADLGAPSIKMDNGDYIRVEDAVLFYKYAILQAAKRNAVQFQHNGRQYKAEDNLALIRYRSKQWIANWKKAGLDRAKAGTKIGGPTVAGSQIQYELKDGFQETGLTLYEWQALEEAIKEIREKGFCAKIGDAKFEDIIKRDELKPVMNNFLADYKSSESQINNRVVLEQVTKGKLVAIRGVLRRLGLQGRKGIEGAITQRRIDTLTQMIEDSRAFDAELERLAYYEATHRSLEKEKHATQGRTIYMDSAFSADRIDYGFQGLSWGVKRLHHLKSFWYTNLRRTVPRAADLVHAMPFSLGKLAREMDFNNVLELAINVNTGSNGMESVDNPALTMFAQRHKDMVAVRGRSEGGVSDQEWKKVWGFWEKPLTDANSLWKLFETQTGHGPAYYLDDIGRLGNDKKETIINHLQEVTLSRFVPVLVATEKSLGEDRQALSSGAGYEENQKFALRFLEWLMSDKGERGDDREKGGQQVQKEIVDIIKLIISPNSYRQGASLWDEFWRKQTPSHNPRLPTEVVPPPTVSTY